MTRHDTHHRSDLNARGRQMQNRRRMAEADVWKLTDILPRLFVRMARAPKQHSVRTGRVAAERRSILDLLR